MKKIKMIMSTISPKLLTKILFYKNFRKKLDLKNPKDINEKIQYLKFNNYNNNEIITKCVDKYRVRDFLREKHLEHLCPELYGVYDKASEINWSELPNSFIIKCNHGSGMNIVCLNKKNININQVIKQLDSWIKTDYWKIYGETQYMNVKKKIIIEELLDQDILTYKFYCFNGNVKVLYVSTDGEDGEKDKYYDYFDSEWKRLDITLGEHKHYPGNIERPVNYDEMYSLAQKLSKDFPFVRVDLYNVNNKIYFSELTFIPTGGMMKFYPKSIIEEWGEWLKL